VDLRSPERVRDPAAAVRGWHLIVYDDSGHLVLWERPERVANDLTIRPGVSA
jgi:hypothetical protein